MVKFNLPPPNQTVKPTTNTLEGLEKQLHETETKAHSAPTASVEKPT